MYFSSEVIAWPHAECFDINPQGCSGNGSTGLWREGEGTSPTPSAPECTGMVPHLSPLACCRGSCAGSELGELPCCPLPRAVPHLLPGSHQPGGNISVFLTNREQCFLMNEEVYWIISPLRCLNMVFFPIQQKQLAS